MLTERRGRDVGFAESGFRPTLVGKIMPTDPFVYSPFLPVASPSYVDADGRLPDRLQIDSDMRPLLTPVRLGPPCRQPILNATIC
jgi:hypothetical protein